MLGLLLVLLRGLGWGRRRRWVVWSRAGRRRVGLAGGAYGAVAARGDLEVGGDGVAEGVGPAGGLEGRTAGVIIWPLVRRDGHAGFHWPHAVGEEALLAEWRFL